MTIDTANLSVIVNIVDGSLSDPDNSSQVTFTFAEAVARLATRDVTVRADAVGADLERGP